LVFDNAWRKWYYLFATATGGCAGRDAGPQQQPRLGCTIWFDQS
jgi:hypothetical protein